MPRKSWKTKEEWKTYGNVFDQFTLRTLFKLSGQGHFEELKSPVSVGKESNVFSATRGNEKIIAKIYRIETCDFNRMYDYIKYDPRFQLKRVKRQIIFSWVQREFRNLYLARKAGVRVPTPIAYLNNILLEEFIGDENPAPKLKDTLPENPEKFFNEIVKFMQILYKNELVHADLSQFNILNHNEHPVFIDFSTCTSINDPRALEYLERDVKNICAFFKKLNVNCDEKEVLTTILKK
ncbi:MAG: serine protein kinase RIO [Candidatus Woesearchaeota archaeon]